MHTLSPRKAIVAFATAMAFVAFMATPASADPPYTFAFTAGLFHVDSQGAAPDIDFEIGVPPEDPEEDPCDLYDPPTTIEVDITGAGPNYATEIQPTTPSGGLGKSTIFNPADNTWYQVDLDISDPGVTGANNSGTLTKTGPTTWDLVQNVWIEVRVYDLGNPPSCIKDDNLVCSLIIVFDGDFSAPLTGDYTGTVAPTSVTDITNVNGQGLVFLNGECEPGLAGSYDGSTATLSGASLLFVP